MIHSFCFWSWSSVVLFSSSWRWWWSITIISYTFHCYLIQNFNFDPQHYYYISNLSQWSSLTNFSFSLLIGHHLVRSFILKQANPFIREHNWKWLSDIFIFTLVRFVDHNFVHFFSFLVIYSWYNHYICVFFLTIRFVTKHCHQKHLISPNIWPLLHCGQQWLVIYK